MGDHVTTAAARSVFGTAAVSYQVGRALLWIRPNGWQGKARRNAWSAMVADRQRRVERADADREIRIATSMAGLTVRAQ
jgi:hypothetical protein